MVGKNLRLALISCGTVDVVLVLPAASNMDTQDAVHTDGPDLLGLLDILLTEKNASVGGFVFSDSLAPDKHIFEIPDTSLIEMVLRKPLPVHLLSKKHFREIEYRKGGRQSELLRAKKRNGNKR